MKLLVLSHMFPRRNGDWDGVFIHEQVAALRRRGIDARVLVGNAEGVTATSWRVKSLPSKPLLRYIARPLTQKGSVAWQDVGGVPTAYFAYPAPYPPHWDKAAIFYAREALRATGQIRPDFDFDLVHAHTAFLDGVAGVAIARRFRRKCVITEHTGPFSTLTETRIMRWFSQWSLNHADLVIAVSRAELDDMKRHLDLRRSEYVAVVGNGMRSDIFRPRPTPRAPDGLVRALWVGGMHPVKQLPMLLDAYSIARSARAQLRLTIAGDGPLSAEIDREIAARQLDVERLPSQTRQEVAELLHAHDFLVVCSASESFSIIVIEAMGCGCPVLSTRCGGPEDTIVSPKLGLMVHNHVVGLSQGLIEMADRLPSFDPHHISRFAHEHHDIDAVAGRIEALLRTTL
jgi:glycosyltransferase involved in cell wall biosynthesis